jgi:hypothetical protein
MRSGCRAKGIEFDNIIFINLKQKTNSTGRAGLKDEL